MAKKSVVITGANRGLGLELTKLFLEADYEVVGISKSDRDWKQIPLVVKNVERLHLFRLDLTSEKGVQKWFRMNMKRFNNVKVLINNAGTCDPLRRIEQFSSRDVKRDFVRNVLSAFHMSQMFIPYFQERKGGQIVNISSKAGKRAVPRLFPYSASKSALLALSQCIAKENVESNIKSFTVCPGGINTSMRAKLFGKKDAEAQQSPSYVASVIFDCVMDKINVESGGDIVIRHGEIESINPAPGI